MQKIKITIIVPAYNSQNSIKKCLDSILNQTLTELEIIVINDGSSDGTLKIVEKIKDSRLLLINKKNEGVSQVRNDAFK